MTRDIDLVAEISTGDTERVCELFESDFYVDRNAVQSAIVERTIFNLIHTQLVIKVDIIVRKDSPYRLGEFSRRRRVTVDDLSLFLVAAEDLIISKLDWARDTRSEVQRADVRNLLELTTLDREYLTQWVGRLGLESVYREFTS
jgi:hypothetical protein